MKRAIVIAMLVACGGSSPKPTSSTVLAAPATAAERILALLPPGAQVVIELDLARLRANPVVGAIVMRAVADSSVLDLPSAVPGVDPTITSPLALAQTVVLAAYGVGTAEAATVTVLAVAPPAEGAKPIAVPGAIRITDELYAIGPEAWVNQLEFRAAIALTTAPLVVSAELRALRDHAMPPNAPGASLRITAKLSFDARVSLAREIGLAVAPAQVSVWADVADDLVVVVDADAADPGEAATKKSAARLEAMIKTAIIALANAPATRSLGLPASLGRARLVTRGSWVRTIVAIGPSHLQRVVARASELLDARPASAGDEP